MTKTCQDCQHRGEYKCSHPDGYSRPTYSKDKEEKVTYSPACDLYEKVETPDRDQPPPIPKPEYAYGVITMQTSKDPKQLDGATVQFQENVSEALNDDWHRGDFTACLDGDQIVMVQTLVKQVS